MEKTDKQGSVAAAGRVSVAHHDIWSGFHRKTLAERRRQVKLVYPDLFPHRNEDGSGTDGDASRDDDASSVLLPDQDDFPIDGLDPEIANNMIENCIGCLGMPLGLAVNFIINGVPLGVPMVTEEPSVIAAVSGAAKTMSNFGSPRGFVADGPRRNVIFAQIQLLDIPDSRMDAAVAKLESERVNIMALANQYCQSMVNRGGGVVGMQVRRVPRTAKAGVATTAKEWLVVQLSIDVCDAMGANCASTVAEGTAPLLRDMLRCRIGLRIVSNLCTERISRARFSIPVANMKYKGYEGRQVAERIIEANDWACDDIYRATTHNKGIMNGIDACSIALGQDWRAIEAAAHAYATRSGRYQALTRYWIEKGDGDEDLFCGELELPLSVGTKGGVLKTHPTYGYNLHIAGNPDAKEVSKILACVGLAQNFAALRALTTEGIQRGHLSLHSRNIAIAAGAPPHAVAEVTAYMVETNRMTIEAAKQYLEAHEILGIVRQRESPSQGEPAGPPPSMFYFEEHNSEEETAPGVVTFNVAFDTWTSTPNYLEYTAETEPTSMTSLLFGERTYGWLKELMKLVSQLHLSAGSPTRHNRLEIRKLYTMSIVVNVLARRLMAVLPKETFAFVDDLILGDSKFRDRAKAPEVASRPRGHSQQRSRSGSIADLSARLAAMHHLIPPVVNTYVSEIRAERRGTPSKHGLRDPGEFGVDWLLPSELSLGPEDILPSVDDASEQTRTMAAVGFPLLFAMLQVFQLIVTQRVGHPGLAASILEEQRRVLAAIVCRPLNEPCRSQNDFEDFIGVHCTRFQMTLFLLLEGAALDEATVNEAVLAECKVLGKALDIVAKCHDVARLERDYRLAGGRFALDGSLANNGVVNGAALFAASQGLDAGALFVGVGNADSIELSPAAKDMVAAFLRESLYVTQLSEGARKQYQTFVTVVRKHYGM